MFLLSVMSLGEVKVKPFHLYMTKSSYHFDLSSESSRLTELVNYDYSPQCFVIIRLKRIEEQFPAEDQCHNYSPSPPSSGDCSIELLMQLHTGSLSNTRFSAQRLFFAFSPPFFLQSQSPFSISIRRHPSAKCISSFSGYPSISVSALLNTDPTAAAAA